MALSDFPEAGDEKWYLVPRGSCKRNNPLRIRTENMKRLQLARRALWASEPGSPSPFQRLWLR